MFGFAKKEKLLTWEELKKEALEKNSKIKKIKHNFMNYHRDNEIHVRVIFENDEQVNTVIYYEEKTKDKVLFQPKWMDFLSEKTEEYLNKKNSINSIVFAAIPNVKIYYKKTDYEYDLFLLQLETDRQYRIVIEVMGDYLNSIHTYEDKNEFTVKKYISVHKPLTIETLSLAYKTIVE